MQAAERPRQIRLDEALGASQALEPDLDEDPRRILDVVAGRLHQARHLVQLGDDTARTLGERRVVEEDLPGEARREQIAVVLRVALPRPHRLELEQPRADVRVERGALKPLHVGEPRRIDRAEPPRERAEVADLPVDRRAAEILDQIVVKVNAVKRRVCRVHFMEPRKVLVHEMRQRFGRIHLVESAPRAWPASCMWSPRPSATSRM